MHNANYLLTIAQFMHLPVWPVITHKLYLPHDDSPAFQIQCIDAKFVERHILILAICTFYGPVV